MKVFVLHHQRTIEEIYDETALLGIFSTRFHAEKAKAEYLTKPGFGDFPNDFFISEYQLGEVFWKDGFVTKSVGELICDIPPWDINHHSDDEIEVNASDVMKAHYINCQWPMGPESEFMQLVKWLRKRDDR